MSGARGKRPAGKPIPFRYTLWSAVDTLSHARFSVLMRMWINCNKHDRIPADLEDLRTWIGLPQRRMRTSQLEETVQHLEKAGLILREGANYRMVRDEWQWELPERQKVADRSPKKGRDRCEGEDKQQTPRRPPADRPQPPPIDDEDLAGMPDAPPYEGSGKGEGKGEGGRARTRANAQYMPAPNFHDPDHWENFLDALDAIAATGKIFLRSWDDNTWAQLRQSFGSTVASYEDVDHPAALLKWTTFVCGPKYRSSGMLDPVHEYLNQIQSGWAPRVGDRDRFRKKTKVGAMSVPTEELMAGGDSWAPMSDDAIARELGEL